VTAMSLREGAVSTEQVQRLDALGFASGGVGSALHCGSVEFTNDKKPGVLGDTEVTQIFGRAFFHLSP
jgi:hypothetical protein